MYPDDGAVVPPTKIEVLVGGKRKGRRARTKTRNKKNKSHHGMVHGGCRVISTPSLNGVNQRDCMERALHSLLTPKEKELVIRQSEPFPLPSDGGDVFNFN